MNIPKHLTIIQTGDSSLGIDWIWLHEYLLDFTADRSSLEKCINHLVNELYGDIFKECKYEIMDDVTIRKINARIQQLDNDRKAKTNLSVVEQIIGFVKTEQWALDRNLL